jgi:hypothetical protein
MKVDNQLPLIHAAATRAREAVKKMADGFYINPENLCGGCAIASYITWKALQRLGVEGVQLVLGSYDDGGHCWVEFEGRIFDATATQFNLPGPVYVTAADDPEYSGHLASNPPEKLRDGSALKELECGWWPQQSPFHGSSVRFQKGVESTIDTIVADLEGAICI